MSEKTLGANLAEARKAVNLTQVQVAEFLGRVERTIQNHEGNEHRPGNI